MSNVAATNVKRSCEILVIEDDRDIRESLEDVLTDAGFTVTLVEGGRAALASLRSPGAAIPCVILLDLMMPDMDGTEFRSLQSADPILKDVPVVIVSAHREYDRIARTLGVPSFLRKPVDVDDLLATLSKYCHPSSPLGVGGPA